MSRAHYLPQSYLANFTDPDTPQGQEPYVWILEDDVNEWRRRAPVNVGWENDYYILTDENGVESKAIETELSGVEGEAARIINRLISEERPFGDGDRHLLATHIASMNVRMPAHHVQMGDFRQQLANMTRQLAKQYGIEDPLEPSGKLDPQVEQHNDILRLAFSTVEKQARVISAMSWRIWVSKPPHLFGTCDFPVAVMNPEIPDGCFYRPGMLQTSAMLLFPLTRSAMLVADWRRHRLEYVPMSPEHVENFNLCAWRYTRRMFIAPKPDIPGAKVVLRAVQERATQDRG